ncbi:hypothetical protein QJS10_CPB12g01672 [Acorus calamus]|uniref:Uncharacterized protein n=1 Tax=Acorus calamus TaxID=4465 RepID=A0AAV9DL14_ACOCL|nr:hypothetical protein QJS10_CPB12g01672 [Acorus calamus]
MVRARAHGIAHPLEMVETVMEVADVAWEAYEHRLRHLRRKVSDDQPSEDAGGGEEDYDVASLRSENLRLRSQLEENLSLLESLARSPPLSSACPPDLHVRLAAAVDSSNFLNHLQTLQQAQNDNFPFKEATESDLHLVEDLVNVDLEQPSWWVWVTPEMVPSTVEELSGIDNENYVIINEEHIVDGVANFLAKCILANPKSKRLTPEELQKTVARALGGMNDWGKMKKVWHAAKLFYAFSTWGIALAGLYRHRAIVKAAAKGVQTSGKLIMKAL